MRRQNGWTSRSRLTPSLVPVKAGERIKTDRRDARKLTRCLRAGDLTAVYVPDEATEALRDLERARDAAKKAEIAAKHQLGKFLLRQGRRFNDGSNWTQRHLAWIRRQTFEHEAHRRVLRDSLKAVEDAAERVARLMTDIQELVEQTALAPLIVALQALRGFQVLSAKVSDRVRQIAWTAQKRLHRKFCHLVYKRGKPPQVAVTAVARELAGFVWAIGQQKQLLAE